MMREKKNGKPIAELPDEIRHIIRQEVEDGLVDFSSKDFEGATRARLRPARGPARRRLESLRVAPAVGLALAAVMIGAAILWFAKSPPSPSGPGFLALSLEISPGLMNLQEYPLPSRGGERAVASAATDLVGRALFSAAGAAASSTGPGKEGPVRPVPRTSLEQKMKILYGDRTIERALESFREKFKEV